MVSENTTSFSTMKTDTETAMSEIVTATSDGMTEMTDTVSDNTPKVETAFKELCSSAIEGANTALGISAEGISQEYVSVGYSIPAGIAQGINDGKELVINALQGVLSEAMGNVKVDGLVNRINKELGALIE